MVNVSYLVVTYNSAVQIKSLLDSIAKTGDGLTYEVIIVDNNSSDQTVKIVRQYKLKHTLIANKTNPGFAKAVNQGLTEATGECIFLLNPDTRLVGNVTKNLYQFTQKVTPLGAVAPRLVSPNGQDQPSVFHFPTISNALLRYAFNQQDRYGKYLPKRITNPVDVAVMAALFIPKTTIEKVGQLDERFFLYYEDIEFCRRLKKAGLPVFYYPTVKVMHVHGASGHFKSHLESPLLRSAIIYHGPLYFKVLNLVLWAGQKFELVLKRLHLR
jgi:GT2 family glycosyltransferase